MIINALDNLEVPDDLIQQWLEEADLSEDVRYTEKKVIEYIRFFSPYQGPITILSTGSAALLVIGENESLVEEEGFYIG